ncbi:MAG TPA: FAD-binding oxidoreductase [Streptosporangiaceae bacterium]|nr:FAD-binding oxidoreductase [Streptosporangiaceae bacterium]
MAADSIPAQLATACPAIRPAGPADAVAGVQPSFVAAPASTAEASALLRAAASLDLAVVPRGTGTRLHWGTPPARCDLVVETTLLNRVIEHAAGDLVATVQAGISLEYLAEVLGQAGQRLALDPPSLNLPEPGPDQREPGQPERDQPGPGPAAADLPFGTEAVPSPTGDREPRRPASRGTIGGVIAAGAAGPLRFRYGSPRDLLIGITVVRADGTVARSGGKVVKNVAGYDLGKLFAGSRGTLGLITEATFRLHPVPSAIAYITVECAAAADACRLITAGIDSPLVPVAAEIDWPGADSPVLLGFALEGDATAMAERSAELADLLAHAAHHSGLATVSAGPQPARSPTREGLRAVPEVSENPPRWWGAGPAAQSDGTVLQIAFWPGDLGLVLAEVRTAAGAAGLDPAVGGSAAAGLLHVAVPADATPDSVAAFVADIRSALGHVSPVSDHHRLNDLQQAGRSHPPDLSHPHGRSHSPGQAHPSGRSHPPDPSRSPNSSHDTNRSRAIDAHPPARASAVVLHAPADVSALIDLFGPVPSLGLMRAVKDQFDPDCRMAPGRFAGGI